MRGLVTAGLLTVALFSSGAAESAGRAESKRNPIPTVGVQEGVAERGLPSKDARQNRATSTSWSPTFRAEDIVPDICKGCSS